MKGATASSTASTAPSSIRCGVTMPPSAGAEAKAAVQREQARNAPAPAPAPSLSAMVKPTLPPATAADPFGAAPPPASDDFGSFGDFDTAAAPPAANDGFGNFGDFGADDSGFGDFGGAVAPAVPKMGVPVGAAALPAAMFAVRDAAAGTYRRLPVAWALHDFLRQQSRAQARLLARWEEMGRDRKR